MLVLVIRDFRDDQCLLRASALTFTSILSLVPFFALTFAVLKGFGVHNKIEPLILDKVAAGSQETVDNIVTYINNTNMTSLGAIGLVALILTVISVLGNIEEAFNVIWGVRETRSFYRKFSDYLSVLITAPVLLLAGISITSSLQNQSLVLWLVENSYLGDFILFLFRLAPYVTIWLALVFLYIFIPNTRVRFSSALVGGIIAGTMWQIAQWGYIHFQVGVAKYNAIYGALAVLPVFLVWIYTSWLIVLFGVEVVCAHQNIRIFLLEVRNISFSQNRMELLHLAVLEKIGASFHFDREPWTSVRLAEALNIPAKVVRDILARLMENGFVLANSGDPATYTPARELEHIAVKDVIDSLRKHGDDCKSEVIDESAVRIRKILKHLDCATANALGGMTLKDMVTEQLPQADPTATVVDKTG